MNSQRAARLALGMGILLMSYGEGIGIGLMRELLVTVLVSLESKLSMLQINVRYQNTGFTARLDGTISAVKFTGIEFMELRMRVKAIISFKSLLRIARHHKYILSKMVRAETIFGESLCQ